MSASQKIVNLGLLVTGCAVFFFMANLTQSIWGLVGLPRMADWLVSPAHIISFALTAGGGLYVRRSDHTNQYLNEVVQELSKVTWPTQKETVISTGVACVLVVFSALVLLGYDSLWGTVLGGLFR